MLWQRLNVGSEIAVYSKEYKGYFACSVIKTKNKSSSLFQVEYEDDSTEWTDLSKEKFRWQHFDDEEFDSDNDDVDNDNNDDDDDDDASDNNDDDDDDDKSNIDDYEEEDNKISDVDDDKSSDDTFKRKTTTSSTSSNKRMKKEEDNADDDNNDCEKDDRDKEEHTDIKKLVVPKTNPMQVASKKKSTKTEDNGKNNDDDSHDAVMINKDDGTEDEVNDSNDDDCMEEANEEEDDDEDGTTQKKQKQLSAKAKKVNNKSNKDDDVQKLSELSDGKTTSTIKRLSNKEVKKAHDNKELTKQNALLHIMVNHHMVGTTYLTFEQIFKDLGFKPKDKAIEQAWKEVCANKLVEEANVSDGAKKHFQLTPEGIELAASEDYKYQLANPPQTTEELHEQIKKSASKCGVQIFDLLLKNGSMSTDELADECGVSKKGHNFVHGFKQHKTFGYVIKDPNSKRASWILSPDKAFIN